MLYKGGHCLHDYYFNQGVNKLSPNIFKIFKENHKIILKIILNTRNLSLYYHNDNIIEQFFKVLKKWFYEILEVQNFLWFWYNIKNFELIFCDTNKIGKCWGFIMFRRILKYFIRFWIISENLIWFVINDYN